MIHMIKQRIKEDELLLETPFLRRLHDQARQKGLEEGMALGCGRGLELGRELGRDLGQQHGLKQGIKQGRIEGELIARRKLILDALTVLFDPAASVYREVEKELTQVAELDELERLFATVIRAKTVADFQAALPSARHSTTKTD
jgi:flagellar biosynthesis/type III secretory pathway protein FliH